MFPRNFQFFMPLIFTAIAFGLSRFEIKFPIKLGKYIFRTASFLILLAVLPQTISQFRGDSKVDSRLVAKDYITQERLESVWANGGCTHEPIVAYQSTEKPNYIVLDSWFGGINEKGVFRKPEEESWRKVIESANYRDLHYINHNDTWGEKALFSLKDRDQYMKDYKLIKTISEAGPTVFIFQKLNSIQ
jgi:hypothetical protein